MPEHARIIAKLQRRTLFAILGGQALCIMLMIAAVASPGPRWPLVAGFAASLAGSAGGIVLGLRWRAIRRQARAAGWAVCDRCLYPAPTPPPRGAASGAGAAPWVPACPECGNDLGGLAARWARTERG